MRRFAFIGFLFSSVLALAPASGAISTSAEHALIMDGDTGQVTQVPVPPETHLYVQVGAFGSYENAMRMREQLGGDLRISTTTRNGQKLYRVRTAPLDSTADADAALARLNGLGSNDAHIVVDQ